jgi:hypothetical protein
MRANKRERGITRLGISCGAEKLWDCDRKNAVARAGRVFERERVRRARRLGDGGVAELERLRACDRHVIAETHEAGASIERVVECSAARLVFDLKAVEIRDRRARADDGRTDVQTISIRHGEARGRRRHLDLRTPCAAGRSG